MTTEQAIETLQRVNRWRRGDEEEYVQFKLTEEALLLAFPNMERETAKRLKKYATYVKGESKVRPEPKQLTADINEAISVLKKRE